MISESADNNRRRWQGIIGATAIVLLTFLVYCPVLPGSFLMDDARLIGRDNPLVTGELTLRSLWFGTDFTFATFVWWLEHLAFGGHPAGYHVVNIVLQAVSAVLLWRLLDRLKIPGAWLAGALFAIHPVCVNSVTRIAELKNTLSLPFFLLSFIAYLDYESVRLYPQPPRPGGRAGIPGLACYVVSLLAFLLALMAKTTVVMLPVVLLLCAAWRRRRIQWRDLVHTAPFFALSIAFGLMSIWFQKHQALPTSPLALQPAPFLRRLAGAGYDFWFYLGKALFPFDLNLEYPRWQINPAAVTAFLPDVFTCAFVAMSLLYWRSWGRHALFGVGCFAVILFPALGFFDAQFEALWQVSDHLQYTALPAIVALVAGTLAVLLKRSAFRAAAFILLAAASALCFARAEVFKNEKRLMTDAISKNPAAWGARNDLGVILAESGDYSNAITQFDASIKSKPDNTEARLNLAYALVLQRKPAEAAAQYQKILKLNPHDPAANKMYARLLELQGRNADAIQHFQISAIFNPDAGTLTEMATLDYAAGNWRRVVADLKWSLEVKPDAASQLTALNNLAWVLATCPDASVRNGNEAIHYATQACRLTKFSQAGLMNTLGAAYAEAGRFPDAIATAETAAKLATESGDTQSETSIRRLLSLYRAGKPCRENQSGH